MQPRSKRRPVSAGVPRCAPARASVGPRPRRPPQVAAAFPGLPEVRGARGGPPEVVGSIKTLLAERKRTPAAFRHEAAPFGLRLGLFGCFFDSLAAKTRDKRRFLNVNVDRRRIHHGARVPGSPGPGERAGHHERGASRRRRRSRRRAGHEARRPGARRTDGGRPGGLGRGRVQASPHRRRGRTRRGWSLGGGEGGGGTVLDAWRSGAFVLSSNDTFIWCTSREHA